MSNVAQDFDSFEFMRGQQDCIDGEECLVDASDSYMRGYGTQYEWEQIKTNQSEV